MNSPTSKLLILLLAIQLLSIMSLNIVHASPGVEITIKWVDPFYEGYDEYYDRNVIAYPAAKTVEFRVRVSPYRGSWPYTEKVEIRYISIEILGEEIKFNVKRENISVGDWKVYSVNVSLPSTPGLYSYTVTVLYKEYYSGGTSSDELTWKSKYENLAVYSSDQISYRENSILYNMLRSSYSWQYFNSTEARFTLREAELNVAKALYLYRRGRFSEARDAIINATSIFRKAIELEKKFINEVVLKSSQLNIQEMISDMKVSETIANATVKEAEAKYLDAQANYLRAQADYNATLKEAEAAREKSRAMLIASSLFGLGFLILSIGFAIHMVRKK